MKNAATHALLPMTTNATTEALDHFTASAAMERIVQIAERAEFYIINPFDSMKTYLFFAISAVCLLTTCVSTATAQTHVRLGMGLGNRNIFSGYTDRSIALMINGESAKLYPGISQGFTVAYSTFYDRFSDATPALFIGASGTIYADQLVGELIGIEKLPLGGKISPYVSLMAGLNLGAGFSENQIYCGSGGCSILALYLTAGVAAYPIKNLGVHMEFGGPVTPMSFGISARFGQINYKGISLRPESAPVPSE